MTPAPDLFRAHSWNANGGPWGPPFVGGFLVWRYFSCFWSCESVALNFEFSNSSGIGILLSWR